MGVGVAHQQVVLPVEETSAVGSRVDEHPHAYDYNGQIPPEESNATIRVPQDGAVSGFSTCLLGFAVALLSAAVFTSPRPWYTLLFVILAILPAMPLIRFILRSFQDEAVPRSFLYSQFLLGGVPLVIFAAQVEFIFSAVFAYIVFRSELPQAMQIIENLEGSATSDSGEQTEQLLNSLLKVIPLWKILIYFLLIAFITAGMVEEAGKWIVARRYHKIDGLSEEGAMRIGCRGILASACAGAVGFAMTENVVYVLGISQANRTGFSFGLVAMALLRGILAYPVHIGTQFYVALTAAQRHVLGDRVRISIALVVAVLFHGTFDAVAFVCMVLIGVKMIPEWVGAVVPIFDLMLVGLLLLLCRGRYKALLERERMVGVREGV